MKDISKKTIFKIAAVILSAVMILSCTACSKKNDPTQGQTETSQTTTAPEKETTSKKETETTAQTTTETTSETTAEPEPAAEKSIDEMMADDGFRECVKQVWALANYTPEEADDLLLQMIQWSDLFGYSVMGANDYSHYGCTEEKLHKIAVDDFNVTEEAFERFRESQQESFQEVYEGTYMGYKDGFFYTVAAGWGERNGFVCGVESSEREGDLYHLMLYGFTSNSYYYDGASFEEFYNDIQNAYWGMDESQVTTGIVYWNCTVRYDGERWTMYSLEY